MSGYEYILERQRKREPNERSWRYKGPGYGQGLLHQIGILEPHEVVTCSESHGWLGSCEDFIKQFDLAA